MELVDALTNAGLNVLEAGTGEEAVAYLGSTQRIHVLITDIRMLDLLSGWDVAERFRDAEPSIGVINASANPPDSARQVPESLFFAKPAPVGRLVEACRRLCRA